MAIITECKIERSKVDPSVTDVWVCTDEESEWNVLFTFFDDEISFFDEELIGLTEDEAYELRQMRDLEYLRS